VERRLRGLTWRKSRVFFLFCVSSFQLGVRRGGSPPRVSPSSGNARVYSAKVCCNITAFNSFVIQSIHFFKAAGSVESSFPTLHSRALQAHSIPNSRRVDMLHISALLAQVTAASIGRLHGSRLQWPSASSYTSTVRVTSEALKPPATMTHPPTASQANPNRSSCMCGSGSHRSPPSSVNTSHDDVVVNSVPPKTVPPKTAKRPSLSTHPPQPKRATLMPGNCLHRQLASIVVFPCWGGSSTSAVMPSGNASLVPMQMSRPSGNRAAVQN
jgi:hypothetical protein